MMELFTDYEFPMSNAELQEAINSAMVNRGKSPVMEDKMTKHIESLLAVQLARAKAMICEQGAHHDHR